jgi:multiple RNA-binding domain-containing protein 1
MESTEESSRIFVKNLPPNINEADFRKHFATKGREITDIKLIAKRRIGYVGYKTPADAAKAVKYFNRSYIRMSRISVEVARPVSYSESSSYPYIPNQCRALTPLIQISDAAAANTKTTRSDAGRLPAVHARGKAVTEGPPKEDGDVKKRKRDIDEADPKLREYLEVMNPAHAPKRVRDDDGIPPVPEMAPPPPEDGESDAEYEEIPSKTLKHVAKDTSAVKQPDAVQPPPLQPELKAETLMVDVPLPQAEEVKQGASVDATDDDWLRSRTNRLLDLVDPDDPSFVAARSAASGPAAENMSHIPTTSGPAEDVNNRDAVPSHADPAEDAPQAGDDPETVIQMTARLFVRNLPYTATEENLSSHFGKFGALEEVCQSVADAALARYLPFAVRYDEP